MAKKAPGKVHRKGMTLFELQELFPNELAARKWFEGIIWPDGKRPCPNCGSENTHECSHAKLPCRCRDCRKYFSIKTGTIMAESPLPLLKWVYAIYLDTTSLKGTFHKMSRKHLQRYVKSSPAGTTFANWERFRRWRSSRLGLSGGACPTRN